VTLDPVEVSVNFPDLVDWIREKSTWFRAAVDDKDTDFIALANQEAISARSEGQSQAATQKNGVLAADAEGPETRRPEASGRPKGSEDDCGLDCANDEEGKKYNVKVILSLRSPAARPKFRTHLPLRHSNVRDLLLQSHNRNVNVIH
jgi:hypothetical protein